jgi:hypothetical protein
MQEALFDRLAAIPPGPRLGVLLAHLPARAASDLQLHDLLAAQSRQLSFQQAQVWQTMAEIGVRDPMVSELGERWTPEEVFESAVDEIRAELRLTRRAARRELEHARAVTALPPVAAALAQGRIDRGRAIVVAEGCAGLTEAQVTVLLDKVLPDAAAVTVTRLGEKIRTLALALDPGWAERRYRQALHERRLISYLNENGSATVSAQYLPADQAATACARVDALAAAAKRAGAAAPIDHLRVELFLGLLDGRFDQLAEPAIIAVLVEQFPKVDLTAAQPEPAPATAPGTAAPTAPAAEAAAVPAVLRGVHVRVGLNTLLGLTDEPGEIAGMGPVPASVARTLTNTSRHSQWRFAIVDADGHLLYDGTTRHRPISTEGARQARGGIVELHVPLRSLTEPGLAATHPTWAGLLGDLARQYANQQPIEQDPAARFAGRALRRHRQVLHPRCLFPSCRRPASQCDLDHHHEWARGGPTDDHNTGPACRHDHNLKTNRGWQLVPRTENTHLWVSPLGRRHLVHGEPLAAPLPAPVPRPPTPPSRPAPDDPDPPPTFQPLTQRGRPLPPGPAARRAADRAIQTAADPPPF